MKKYKLDKVDIKHLSQSEEGRKYLEYHAKTGGEPLGLMIPFGYPHGVEERGGVIAVYDECIRLGMRWEELLDFHPPQDADL